MRDPVSIRHEVAALIVRFFVKVTLVAGGMLFLTVMGHAQSELPSPAAHILVLGQESSNASYPYLIDANGTPFSAISVQEDLSQLSDFVSMDCPSSGDFILFSAGQLYKMKPDGTELELIFGGGYITSLAISPDNTRVAFSGMFIQPWYSAMPAIFVMNTDGSNLVKLTQNSLIEEGPTWSPDGQQIAFAYDDNGTQGIAIIGVDGSNQTRITESSYYDAMPHWSPDGQRITFASNRDGYFNIYSVNGDGSDLEQLTSPGTGQNILPKWSPDGAYISFSSDRGGEDYEIYRMNADGSTVLQLTDNSGYDFNQCWLVTIEEPPTPTLPPPTSVPTPTPTPSLVANARPDQSYVIYVEACQRAPCRTPVVNPVSVTLDGSSSTGAITAYEWTRNGQVVSTQPSFNTNLGIGSHVFTLKVSNASGFATDSVTVWITSCDPNSCAAIMSPTSVPEQ